jgi:radical SAM protein with 4Fe4S-binding SPASM domain
MIRSNPFVVFEGPVPPRLRVREEAEGGLSFDPDAGTVKNLAEKALAQARSEAADDPRIIYYAARKWSDRPPAKGCLISPTRIYLEVTSRCNLRCQFCFRDAGAPGPGELDTDRMTALVRTLAAIGIHELRLTGGEPTLRRDILAIIDEAVSQGLFVTLSTNGVFSAEMLADLTARKVGRYLVSLEGVRPVHEAMRGSGTFEPTMQTIDGLVAAGKRVRVNTLLARPTLERLPELLALLRDHRVRHAVLIAPRPLGRAARPPFADLGLGPAEMDRVARAIGPLSKESGVAIEFHYDVYRGRVGQPSDPVIRKRKSCPAGREAAFISPDGLLYACGCAADWLADPAMRDCVLAGSVAGLGPEGVWELWQRASVWRPLRDWRASKAASCLRCTHYGHGCFGSCPIHSYAAGGAFNAPDPLCWLKESPRRPAEEEPIA